MIETYTIKYSKLKRRTGYKLLMPAGFAIAFAVSLIFRSTSVSSTVSLIIVVSTGLLYSYLSKQRENPIRYFDKPLVISPTSIKIGVFSYELEDVVNLKLEINEFDGQEQFINGSDKYLLNGTDNRLSFLYFNQTIKVKFYLISEIQKDQFREIFHYWYTKRFPFDECDKGGKTYLLQKLNYKEIQEFKKTYSL